MDKIWQETLTRIDALERVVDAMAARLAKLDQEPEADQKPKKKPKKKSK